jgi:hypothetical protein
MAQAFTVTIRSGGKVAREHATTLGEALSAAARHVARLEQAPERAAIDLRVRRFEPVAQVAGRVEVEGPGRLRGGVDVRGDGSSEAFVGRLRKRLVEQRDHEQAIDALRRVLHEQAGEPD